MIVMKFGGSSLATPRRLETVARLVLAARKRRRVVVVVSAFQGVTNDLLTLARMAESGDPALWPSFRRLARRHTTALSAVAGAGRPGRSRLELVTRLEELRNALTGIHLLTDAHPRALDLVASFGERMSALILAAALGRGAFSVDTRELIVTDDQFTRAAVLFEPTNERLVSHFRRLMARSKQALPVVTGFIAATLDGRTTTIGRNGSDYTASIVGAALSATSIEIWTDVDGILSADPRVVAGAFVVPRVSYEEAMEMSYFGANVLHPAAILPAVRAGIPLVVRNTLRPGAPGTRIASGPEPDPRVAKGITSIGGMTLLTLRGAGLVGVPGVAHRLFGALASREVNVILISQASSEHTICFAVAETDAPRARLAIAAGFHREMTEGLVSLEESGDRTIVAIVGDGMRGTPGVSGRVFDSLGRHGVSINAIAQGASERNISFVVDRRQASLAVNVVHEAFFGTTRKLAIAVLGVGNIGKALLTQLRSQRSDLLARGFDIRVVAVANSRRLLFNADGLPLARWPDDLAAATTVMSPDELIRRLATVSVPDRAIIDCTASEMLVASYADFLNADCHLVTPNKKANVLPPDAYDNLMNLVAKRRKRFLFEANVGAGLPVISTLHDLVASGDTVERIEGILSGTLSSLFNRMNGNTRFSDLVLSARDEGLTEPDPRDDLSGQDVARKLLILARQLGRRLALNKIPVESLVPAALRKGPFRESFFVKLARHDEAMSRRWSAAHRRGRVLRYVGTLDSRGARAGLVEFPESHPFAHARGSDNVIVFTTARYATTPLVIQGPGAGADVTAMGVFSDVLKLMHSLPS
ncbi:MAG: bifunctional aspartate kinase/homoserine dehydrogenase I [Candidatus Eisenbacteria bacterium]|nr:bifunctional aspartate kinase/homoserine dehydrogenase I [Candidatus Eisenbacteria bacterium]